MAIKINSILYGCGKGFGENATAVPLLGNGSTANLSQITQIGTRTDFVFVSLGVNACSAIISNGNLFSCGGSAWGPNATCENGTESSKNTFTVLNSSYVHITTDMGVGFGMSVTSDYSLCGWGNYSNYEFGWYQQSASAVFRGISTKAKVIAASDKSSLILAPSNLLLYGSGLNSQLQLGLGSSTAKRSGYTIINNDTDWASFDENRYYSLRN